MDFKKLTFFIIICILSITIVAAASNDNITDDTQSVNSQDTSLNKYDSINTEQSNYNENSHIQNQKAIKKDSKNIILNSSTFDEYISDKKLNDNINDGDTLDFQGLFDGYRYSIEINKAVNIISSTHDAFFTNDMTDNIANTFVFSYNSSGSNISDITFHNTHIYTTNAHNITINNITATCDAMIAMGRGMFSIRDGSSHINITDSYFETFPNGGHSNVVFAYAHDCIFENNTVKGHGWVGNLVYITTFGSSEDTGETNVTYGNSNITICNNFIDGTDATDSGICVGIVVEGVNHTIVNNTILKTISYMIQVNDYGTNTANITFENNYCPLGEIDIINITDSNYETYGLINDDVYTLNDNVTNKNIIISITNAKKVYSQFNTNIIAINSNITSITLDDENIKINQLYAPNTDFVLLENATITNSTIKSLLLNNPQSTVINNIIINKDDLIENITAGIVVKACDNQTIIKDNYILAYNSDEIVSGDNAIKILSGTSNNIENNTPNYENAHILNTTTYSQLFNEDNILKDEINGTIILTQTITQPIIINKAINITTQKIPEKDKELRGNNWGRATSTSNTVYVYPTVKRTIPQYTDIIFTDQSSQSNLTSSYLNNLNINSNNNIITNNSITGQVTITSENNTIKNNTVKTTENYTILLEETSKKNMIINNTLTANILEGYLSISNNENNIIENNTPLASVDITIKTNTTKTDGSSDILVIEREYELTINVTAYDEAVKNGYILLLSNGTQLGKYQLENGIMKTNITIPDYNHGNLKAWYYPDEIYKTTSQLKTLKLLKTNTITTINASNTKIGEEITVYANILNEFNETLPDGNLIFIVNGTEYNTSIINGSSTFRAITNETWINGIQAKYYSTDIYNQSSSNILKLDKGDVLFKITQEKNDDSLIVKVAVTDINYNPVSRGYVRFKNGTKTLSNSQVINGTAQLNISFTDDMEGTVILASFVNNNAFNNKEENITLTSNPPQETYININPITGQTNEEINITALVTTENATLINEGTVTFITTDYNQTVNVTNGIATTIHIFTSQLQDNLTVTYSPSNTTKYTTSTNSTTIDIEEKIEYRLKIDTTTFTIGEKSTIQASIYANENISLNITMGKVIFKINGKTLKDDNGKIIYAKIVNGTAKIENYTIPATWNKENLTIEAVYSGSKQQTSLRSDKELITIEEPTPTITTEDMTATKGETITLTATVKQGNTLLEIGKVVFKINGKTLKDNNGKVIYLQVENGQVTTNYTIPDTYKAKTYIITATYIATGYDRLESTKTLTITA